MKFIRRLLKPLAPLYDHMRARWRRRRVRLLVARLRNIERTHKAVMPLVRRLRDAWGNDSYTADIEFLDAMVTHMLTTRGPYLDCGSGISTVILGALVTGSRNEVWSLEQDAQWYGDMQQTLADLQLVNVRLLYAPLAIVSNVTWYTFDAPDFPAAFPLVICDGPAVRKSHWPADVFTAWRSGLVPELERRGVTFDTVLLDDGHDKRCPQLMAAWTLAGLHVEMVDTPTGSYVRARHVRAVRASATERGSSQHST